MKRTLTLLLVFLTAMALFAGGRKEAEDTGGTGEEEEVRTLRVAAPPWIYKKFDLENFSMEFDKQHPELKLELIRADKWGGPAYITEWEQGTTPFDVFVGGSGSMLSPLIAGGWTEPMDEILTGSMAKDKFVGGFLAAGHYKNRDTGKNYYPCIPFVGEVSIIGVNTEMMKKAGLWKSGSPTPIPGWDEDEFFDWFSKLAGASELGGHVQIWDREFMQYNYAGPIKAMTGTFMEENGKGFDVSSDAAKKWLGYLQKMYEEDIAVFTTTDDQGYAKWKTNATGSFYAAQGHIMELVNAVTNDESDIAYLGWPGADKNGSIIWTHSVWIPRVAKNKDLAELYIREVVFSKAMQQWSFNNYGKLPVMKDYYGEGIERFADQMPIILDIADASSPIPLFADLQEYLDILQKYLPEAAFGRMGVEEALNKVQQESQDLDFSDLRAQ